MPTRLSHLRAFFSELKVDALLVVHDANIRYLTGFPATDAWLLVTPKKAFYITDSRYTLQAQQELPKGISVVTYTVSLFQTVVDLLEGEKIRALGVEERYLTLQQFNRLRRIASKKVAFKPADETVEVLRSIKDQQELTCIRKAVRLNLDLFQYIKPFIRPGVTEKSLLYKLEDFCRARSTVFSFAPIIASGPNGAFPHARITERKLRRTEPLLIDCGVEFNGYKSDLTRMFFLGRMTPSYRKVLSLIRGAQEEAFKVIRPGIVAKEVDAVSRKFLERHGLARHFAHSLGHGVGLEVHENPRLSQKSGAILQENMVVTVEPGVYFPRKYGVRLEEMVLVTKTGCEVLSDHD